LQKKGWKVFLKRKNERFNGHQTKRTNNVENFQRNKKY
jgi:hypothetical protein